MTHTFITTTIPYVNAAPHLGYALEAVQADVLARHARLRGQEVRLLSGTDDNSLKNVLAAEAAGIGVQTFVDANAQRFEALANALSLSYDDFIRTSSDPRHRRGVEALWHACADDLYRGHYDGLYCVGCEHYLTPDELDAAGHCPEHAAPPQRVSEDNWFFRLSRYAEPIRAAIESGRLRIEPVSRRNEVLGFLATGLRDFSVSRGADRARGWGIPVPGDDGQVIYVWWDALGNYVNSLGYGTSSPGLATWWTDADRRIHVVGKGVLRFHAVYWPAILLSAGLALPTDVLVHDYLTVDGRKISKSDPGTVVSPLDLAAEYGVDAVRWWLLREVPRVGDADFTRTRLVARANADLTGGFGNLVNRVVTMVHRFHGGVPVLAPGDIGEAVALRQACAVAPDLIASALEVADFRPATSALRAIVDEANRFIDATKPWRLAKAAGTDPAAAARLGAVLGHLWNACRLLGEQLAPFLPDAAARIAEQCTACDGRLPVPAKIFDRL